MTNRLPPGKLPHDFLDSLLRRYTTGDDTVLAMPGTGIDATILRTGADLLFAKTDPVTFVTEDAGLYLVNVNANDLAAMGGEPAWFLATLLFPADSTTRGEVETLFAGIHDACAEIGVSFCGGHTEITGAVTRPVAAGTMLGRPMTDRTFAARSARADDVIVMTKGAGIEGTSIIARERRQEVFEAHGWEFVARCLDFVRTPGLSVLPEARAAAGVVGVHAMHDPTEGGVATALHEMADAAGTGVRIDAGAVPVFPETRALCGQFGLDPLGLIASGALLIAVDPEGEGELRAALDRGGIAAATIGRLLGDPRRRRMVADGIERELGRFDRDEILKI